MAGHSKWANIKHRKAAQDAKRGRLWSKLIREITVAARLGGGSGADNPRLRAATDAALAANVPKDTIDRAVQRGAGGGEGADVEEIVYEGYAPGGVAVLVEVMTDNRNRSVAAVRHAFSKHGGNLGTNGSVAYLFNKLGVASFAPGADEDAVLDAALDAGAEDVDSDDDGSMSITTPPGNVRRCCRCVGCGRTRSRPCRSDHGAVELLRMRCGRRAEGPAAHRRAGRHRRCAECFQQRVFPG